MKIKARTRILDGKSTRWFDYEFDIPESEVRRLRGEGEEKAAEVTCESCAFAEETEIWPCPKWKERYSCYRPFPAKPPEAPPVEGSLARAREEWFVAGMLPAQSAQSMQTYKKGQELISLLDHELSEHDTAMSQMMTVEECVRYARAWGLIEEQEEDGYANYLRRRIKERNEGARG